MASCFELADFDAERVTYLLVARYLQRIRPRRDDRSIYKPERSEAAAQGGGDHGVRPSCADARLLLRTPLIVVYSVRESTISVTSLAKQRHSLEQPRCENRQSLGASVRIPAQVTLGCSSNKQYLRPLLFWRTADEGKKGKLRESQTAEAFWRNGAEVVLGEVRLKGFRLTDWFPRAPGVYWSPSAARIRERVRMHPPNSDPELGLYVSPLSKMGLIEEGGIGSIRLRPRKIDDHFYGHLVDGYDAVATNLSTNGHPERCGEIC
jgi:hypothetical protein